MDDLTFCIVHYTKEIQHTKLIINCLNQIRKYYPNNRIIICNNRKSIIVPEIFDYNIEIFNSFYDDSHVYGAINLVANKVKTNNYIILHDSMFLLKELPNDILLQDFYPLWHFTQCRDNYNFNNMFENDLLIPEQDIDLIKNIYNNEYNITWFGVFGGAFGGITSKIHNLNYILNINSSNINNYIGRENLMKSERYLSVLFSYLGSKINNSLNGCMYTQYPNSSFIIPDFNLESNFYFAKIWVGR